MTKCAFCPATAVAFAQVFQSRKKIGSYPVCVTHAAWGYGFQKLGQDWTRTGPARACGIRKGAVPRIKISMTQ